jgi:hypothetical protein
MSWPTTRNRQQRRIGRPNSCKKLTTLMQTRFKAKTNHPAMQGTTNHLTKQACRRKKTKDPTASTSNSTSEIITTSPSRRGDAPWQSCQGLPSAWALPWPLPLALRRSPVRKGCFDSSTLQLFNFSTLPFGLPDSVYSGLMRPSLARRYVAVLLPIVAWSW